MRKVRIAAVAFAALLTSAFVTSCSQEDVAPVNELQVSEAMSSRIADLNFDVSDLQQINYKNPLTGESSQKFLVEGDIMLSMEEIVAMEASPVKWEGPSQEQYRTTNLVGGLPRTLTVLGFTGGSNALDNTARTALRWAVNNYNRLNTGLTLSLSFGTNFQPVDIVVFRVAGGGGGSAGFPSGGDPFKFVQIQSGTSSFGTNVVEHVITHEIGHSVGLRHTDYFDRSFSCGSGGNEGSAGVGAINIPGTPTGIDPNSVMLACFSSTEDGEFGPFDVVALETLY